jgi:hypothetical protein
VRRAFIVGFLAAASIAVSATASPAPVRVDRSKGVRFDLEGSVLTVGLVAPGMSDTRDELWGERIRAVCSPTFAYRNARRSIVHGVQLWPEGQTELTYDFGRDISNRVKWCLLEEVSGGDIAAVQFQVFIAIHGASAEDRRIARQLRQYLWRNASTRSWIRRVTAIVVERKVISVRTRLRHDRRGMRSAREICRFIQGADVADFIAGHTVFGRNDVVLEFCRARSPTEG